MTDKRFRCVFKEHENKNSWSMIKDNQLDKPLYIKDVVDLLNFQNTQIKVLKELLNKLDDKNKQLKEENEQLKSARRDDAKEFSALFRQNFGLKRENEQLEKGSKE